MPPRPRTTPRKHAVQARSRETVDAILGATARVLVREGYDRTSTNRVAAVAGVSVGSLYQYFPNKEALVAALIERHCDEMIAVIEDGFARVATAPLEIAARALVRTQVEAHRVDPRLHKVLIEQVPRVGRLDRMHEVERRAAAMVQLYLEAHRDELRCRDLQLAAFVAVSIVEGLTHPAHTGSHIEVPVERLVDEITDVLVRYLRADAPAPHAPRGDLALSRSLRRAGADSSA